MTVAVDGIARALWALPCVAGGNVLLFLIVGRPFRDTPIIPTTAGNTNASAAGSGASVTVSNALLLKSRNRLANRKGEPSASVPLSNGVKVEIVLGTLGVSELVGAHVVMTRGMVGPNFDAFAGSVIDISGGTIGEWFEAFAGSTVNLRGRRFVLGSFDIIPPRNFRRLCRRR
jgi:hypothetical protein